MPNSLLWLWLYGRARIRFTVQSTWSYSMRWPFWRTHLTCEQCSRIRWVIKSIFLQKFNLMRLIIELFSIKIAGSRAKRERHKRNDSAAWLQRGPSLFQMPEMLQYKTGTGSPLFGLPTMHTQNGPSLSVVRPTISASMPLWRFLIRFSSSQGEQLCRWK